MSTADCIRRGSQTCLRGCLTAGGRFSEIDRLRKLPEDPAPGVPTDALKSQGSFSDACHHFVNFCTELIAEAFASCLVPAPDLKRFIFRLGAEDDIAAHP